MRHLWGGAAGLTCTCLVTDEGQRVSRVAAAGLASRRSVHVPVSVLALVAEDAHHPPPAGTLSRQRVAEAGTPQRTVGHLRPPPVTRALCPTTEDIRTRARDPTDHNQLKVSVNGSCLCSPGPQRCRSNQVCSLGSVVPSCCGGSGDIPPSRRRRRCGHRGQCCCCTDTAHS